MAAVEQLTSDTILLVGGDPVGPHSGHCPRGSWSQKRLDREQLHHDALAPYGSDEHTEHGNISPPGHWLGRTTTGVVPRSGLSPRPT
ncbi:hypothetical protein N7537_011930 [Penicillium hordei]|uniref:Uncharacterized protein n=1 Tax=Penicillium hordei TaxID=40994 RepID=A0AAD6DMU3_9EURO|nr:uncharacterized protein N7537_011930 [Penicillium hordei]KAJ5589252.1 hypothetical protein N7537_011930 [Penicillium hordei]